MTTSVATRPAGLDPANDTLPVRDRGALRFITCGSVDDGKSTLIGRLLHDSIGLLEDQIAGLKDDSRRFGTTGEELDLALLLDGLEAEREQGITIDVAYRFFSTARRAFVVADTPGHAQYTRNMATGASTAELAVLLVDARKGLLEQTRRHAAIVSLLGIRHVVLAVNKIDLVDFSQERFDAIVADFEVFAAPLNFRSVVAIPLSARFGDNVTTRSRQTPWYEGPSLIRHLEAVDTVDDVDQAAFRMAVQWVNRASIDFRGVAGTVASGRVSVGDSVLITSSGQTTRVKRIVTQDGDLGSAEAGRAITLTFTDEVDVSRGDLIAEPRQRPATARKLSADLVWMGETPGAAGDRYLLKIGSATVPATVTRLVDTLDVATLARRDGPLSFALNTIGRVEIEAASRVAFDPYADNRETGAFILIDRATHLTVAAGLVVDGLDRAREVHRHPVDVTATVRAALKSQFPLTVWLTGLPGSGKSTIANLVERRLAALGRHTTLLDGDNLRQGLNADLGFDAAARAENVRRVGEVAKLMTEAGLITLVALVSPFRADRDRVASLFPIGQFVEVFVDASPETCRARDPKGLYAKADAGRIVNFTGRDQAYEPPQTPALVLRSEELSAEEAAERVVDLILARIEPPLGGLDSAQL
ncbi:sulfate adenylyltransferase subunit CysN [Phreatobacter stygius]|uniref:Multifunctional fusion protein n=1 Tax=Phreatobacter stygius TaxID=1940610 RepID=A0A4D7B5L5_9HYPH|nr:sulfate adenylyltransferase subunit CysN [Phreatobacter stygius]QCI65016.1 sulfate adenylyltransferase subunit CysN [Phreatobacter stygius]